jgi:inhibitor of cysteine peptidase
MVNKNRVLRKLVVMFGVVLIMALAFARSGGLTIHADDNGDRVELQKGQTLAVSLPGNISTGYSWEVVGLDEQILRQVGEPTFSPDSNVPGSPGTQTIRFRAAGEGRTVLHLVYHRPWEEGEPARTFSVDVVVY